MNDEEFIGLDGLRSCIDKLEKKAVETRRERDKLRSTITALLDKEKLNKVKKE